MKAIKMDKVVMAIGLVAVILGISAVVGLGLSMNADSGMTHLQHSAIALASVAASNEPVTQPVLEIACVPEIAKEMVVPTQSAKVSESVVSVASNLEPATITTNFPAPATTTNDDEIIVKFKDNAGWSGISYIDPTVASNSTTNNDIDHFLSENNLSVIGYYLPQNSYVLKTKDGSSISSKLPKISNDPAVANVQTKSSVSAVGTFSNPTELASSANDSTSTKANAKRTEGRSGLRMAASAPQITVTVTYNISIWQWFATLTSGDYTCAATASLNFSSDGTSWSASGKGSQNYIFDPTKILVMGLAFSADGPTTPNSSNYYNGGTGFVELNGVVSWNQLNPEFFKTTDFIKVDASGNISGSGTLYLTDSSGKDTGNTMSWSATGSTATSTPPTGSGSGGS